MKKTIILVIPHHFDIYKFFVANLEKMGFEIVMMYISDTEFRYHHFSEKFLNFIKKTFLGDKSYKQILKDRFDDVGITQQLANFSGIADYALVVRPDLFSKKILSELRKKTKLMSAYQWDGMDRYPNAKIVIDIFDRFFLFDKSDYEKYRKSYSNIFFTTNFYFDIVAPTKENPNNKAFFIGSYIEERMESILFLADTFAKSGVDTDINLLYFDELPPIKYKSRNINFLKDHLSYEQVLKKVEKSKIILDFSNKIHSGLSLRIFETLYFSKKLITNNSTVKDYDFYHPDNILVWEDTLTEKEIIDFLSKAYVKLNDEIINRYSFTNSIGHILNLKK